MHQEGGNNFDRMLIELEPSLEAQEEWLSRVGKHPLRSDGRLGSRLRLKLLSWLIRLNLHQPAVMTGLSRGWFDEFQDYWINCLGGHPLTVMDFHQLYFSYRTRSLFKSEQRLDWESPSRHIANWQEPNNLSLLFHYVNKYALRPVWEAELDRLLQPGFRVLEFGCGLAPLYRTYRRFFSHIPCEWCLTDIPIITFHFDRYTYGRERGTSFISITADRMDDPLRGVETEFDLIIVLDVFEHLSRPRLIAEKLLARLKPGGMFYFNYINSEGLGLDTAAGREERLITLEYLAQHLRMVRGKLQISEANIPVCIGVKR